MKILETSLPSSKGEIKIFRLENSSGAFVELSSFGAGVLAVGVPDRNGVIENVALRYKDPLDYIYDGPNMGKIPGRFANRIAEGKLKIGEKDYQLGINLPPHHLHGGKEGFSNRNWEAEIIEDGVRFSYLSPDGEENYPGNLKVTATYRWNDKNELSLDLHAESDKETVVNLTNHTYWNLAGAEAGCALSQELRMKGHEWLPTDNTQIPLGTKEPVAGTPMDFTTWKRIDSRIMEDYEPLKIGKGYDHCWAIDGWQPGKMIKNAVEMREEKSGRLLTISSDQPGVQIYSGNWLKGSPLSGAGREFEDYDGIAIEMQGFPDAPNQPGFPSQTLLPGDLYERRIVFAFSNY